MLSRALKTVTIIADRTLGALLGIMAAVLLIPFLILYPVYAYAKYVYETLKVAHAAAHEDWLVDRLLTSPKGLMIVVLSYIASTVLLPVTLVRALVTTLYVGISKGIEGVLSLSAAFFSIMLRPSAVPDTEPSVFTKLIDRLKLFLIPPINLSLQNITQPPIPQNIAEPQNNPAPAVIAEPLIPQNNPPVIAEPLIPQNNPPPAVIEINETDPNIQVARVNSLITSATDDQKQPPQYLTTQEIENYKALINSYNPIKQRESKEILRTYEESFDNETKSFICNITLDQPLVPITVITGATENKPGVHKLFDGASLATAVGNGGLNPVSREKITNRTIMYIGYPEPLLNFITHVRTQLAIAIDRAAKTQLAVDRLAKVISDSQETTGCLSRVSRFFGGFFNHPRQNQASEAHYEAIDEKKEAIESRTFSA